MKRLHLLVEGAAEEGFVNLVLRPHLAHHSVIVDARRLQTSRRRGRAYKGGGVSTERFCREVERWMKEDSTARFSAVLDWHRLPADFPGRAQAAAANPARPELVTRAMEERFGARFIGYIQMHEFEALLLTDVLVGVGAALPGGDAQLAALSEELETLRQRGVGPEQVNDGDETKPSARIAAHLPEYAAAKASAGPIAAGAIGLERIRASCPNFGSWLARLEKLDSA